MSLNTLNFFCFFIIVAVIYFICPRKLQWISLLAASLYFYWKNQSYVNTGIFLLIILVNFFSALFMGEEHKHRKAAFRFAIVFDVLLLCIFKYAGFFSDFITLFLKKTGQVAYIAYVEKLVSLAEYFAPMGISYFALILIGYVCDVYWCKVKAQKNPGKLILFTSFFPQMTSGPIVKYEEMEGQLWDIKHSFSYENMVRGGERLLWGIFKKSVLAERCAVIVNTIYSTYEVYAGFYIWIAAAMFALQLYCDFSGLMDIVLGFSEILGIKLPENFKTPFYSLNLSEFWRRWHITLGGFLRDYVLYPVQRTKLFRNIRKICKEKLGKGYEKKWNLPLHLSLLVSWFLIGLWHGGGWNYIFGVGIYMWAVIVIGEILSPVFKWIVKILHINTDCDSYRLFLRLRTFIFFIFGLSFFRAESLSAGFDMWKRAFSQFNIWIFFDKSLYNLGLDRTEWGILIFGLVLLFVVSFISQKKDFRDYLKEQNFLFRIIIFSVLFIMIICYGYYGVSFNAADFIYGRF